MNSDFRLSTTFFENLKTIKLSRCLGADGIIALLKLWAYAAKHKPTGDFGCCDETDIEIIAQWGAGQPGKLVSVLLDLRFLEPTEKGYRLHDWEEHNPWALHAPERTERAKKAAAARWAQRLPSKSSEKMHRACVEQCTEHAECNAPSPSPTPKRKKYISESDLSGFSLFYKSYPLKKNKSAAIKVWNKLKPSNGTLEMIMSALDRQKAWWESEKSKGAFVPEWPHPATWLNDRRWEDEIPEVKQSSW